MSACASLKPSESSLPGEKAYVFMTGGKESPSQIFRPIYWEGWGSVEGLAAPNPSGLVWE